MTEISLGTVAIEPARWAWLSDDPAPPIALSAWLDRIADAGFDGIELWEPHVCRADPDEAAAVFAHPLPVTVFNSYVGFDDPDDTDRLTAAAWIRRSGAPRAKWNTGAERGPAARQAYAERLGRLAAELPGVELVCECHDGSAMDDPAFAAEVLTAGSAALVHTHDDETTLRAKFAAYGDRITHVHVNHLPIGCPPLSDLRDELAAKIDLLRTLGFTGTWTIEFVHGTGAPDLDRPDATLAQAAADLAVLRSLLD